MWKISMALGQRIRLRMAELDLTLGQLARKSGLSQHTISQYIQGKKKPDYDEIVALKKALEVDYTWLFEEELDAPTPSFAPWNRF